MPATRRASTSATSNVIDLTTSSPPPPNRGANGLTLPRAAPVASTSGARSGLRTRAGSSRGQEVIELSSDSEGDDVIVQAPAPNTLNPRNSANARAGPSNARNPPAVRARARVVSTAASRAASTRAIPAHAEALGRDMLDDYGPRDWRGSSDESDDYDDDYGEEDGLFDYGGGGTAALGLARLLELHAGYAGGQGPNASLVDRMRHFMGYGGDGGGGYAAGAFAPNGGLAGLYGAPPPGWGGAAKVRKAKKYGIKMSHPRKIEEGFARDIIDQDASPPPQAKKKNKKAVPAPPTAILEPVCASCLEPLLLAQSGEQRPWALRCGHVVCGSCVVAAKDRLIAARAIVLDDDSQDKRATQVVELDDDDELEYVGDEDAAPARASTAGPTRRSQPPKRAAPYSAARTNGKAKATGKGKAKARSTDVDAEWTSCPVVTCEVRTELDEAEGGMTGAWELFV